MRYAIFFTPAASDPLTLAAASWLGRSVYSGEPVEHPAVAGLGVHEIVYHTALPRRCGFHAKLMAPFRLPDDQSEATLLRELMRYAGTLAPFELPRLRLARLSGRSARQNGGDREEQLALVPETPSPAMDHLAASLVHRFDPWRAPLDEAEIDRRDPDMLTAPQFSNLHRWGDPYVMEEFRFHMPLTGPLHGEELRRFTAALERYFAPLLGDPITIGSVALFVEREQGAPLLVHSLHPMGRVSARRRPVAA